MKSYEKVVARALWADDNVICVVDYRQCDDGIRPGTEFVEVTFTGFIKTSTVVYLAAKLGATDTVLGSCTDEVTNTTTVCFTGIPLPKRPTKKRGTK